MPAFFEADFWNLANAELWVGVGLVLFLGIVWMAGAFKTAAKALDDKGAKIQSDLDEAARIRAEAERLLAGIQAERAEAERRGKEMLAAAEAGVRQFEADAKAQLEESLERRRRMTEQRIATAEAQAMAEVKSAAAELATQMAEQVLAARLAGAKSDPSIDKAISQLAAKLQ